MKELFLHLAPTALNLFLKLEQKHILRFGFPAKLLELVDQFPHLVSVFLSFDLHRPTQVQFCLRSFLLRLS